MWLMVVVVKVQPGAKKHEVVGWEELPGVGRVLKVKVAAPPIEGRANEALVKYLAEVWGLARSQVRLVAGEGSRLKRLEVPDGILGE